MARTALLVSQPTTEGAAVCVAALAKAAVEDGWHVLLACPGEGWLAEAGVKAGATWVELPTSRQPRPDDTARTRELRALCREVDLVHLHSSKAGALGRAALASLPKGQRPPCVFTPHAWSWLVGGRLAPAYRTFERATARYADVIVAVSEAECELGVTALGAAAASRIRVIPNGVDPEVFTPDGERADRSAAPLIVCVGRLCHQKGQDVAIRSLDHVGDRSVRLRLVGDGPDREPLAEIAARHGVAERVEFAGNQPSTAPHYRAADVVVVPSRWDGMSLGLLEAMACGAAVVATDVPGTGALGTAGIRVPVDDPVALAAALDRLLDDPDRRADLGGRARQRILSEFTLERSLGKNLDLWSTLARRQPSHR